MKNCPFEIGKQYIALKDIDFLNHHFAKGEIIIFKSHAYDFHQGVTRFWFSKLDGSETNAWHVFDQDAHELEAWEEFFEPLAP